MKDLIVTINANSRKPKLTKNFLGINGENLQGNIIIDFEDEFIDGICYLEVNDGNEKYFITMEKVETHYILPIKSSLLRTVGKLPCQIRISSAVDEDVSIFKSEVFEIPVLEAINAVEIIPDQYPTFVYEITARVEDLEENKQNKITSSNKLSADFVDDTNQLHKFVTNSEKSQITTNQNNITSLQTSKQDALTTTQMNAVNSGITSSLVTKIGSASLTTTATDLSGAVNELNASKSVVSVSSTGTATNEANYITVNGVERKIGGSGSGSSTWGSITGTLSNQTDLYNALSNKQSKITSFNKLSSGLVDDSQSSNKFVTINEKNAWSGKQDAITSSNKLSADNVDDTSTTNKFVTTSDKNTWNGKQDAITTTLVGDGTLDKVIGFNNNGELVKGTPSATAGVSSLGGATGAITLGSGLAMNGNELRVTGSGGSGSLVIDTLWTNPNPSSNFVPQTVTPENLADYDLILIRYCSSITQQSDNESWNCLLRRGCRDTLNTAYWDDSVTPKAFVNRFRTAIFYNTNTIVFGDAAWGVVGSNKDINNSLAIPVQIYGIK